MRPQAQGDVTGSKDRKCTSKGTGQQAAGHPRRGKVMIRPAICLAFALCTLGNVCSTVGFKRFVESAAPEPTWSNFIAAITNPWAWLGLSGGLLFLLSYLFILRTLAVSVAFPVIVGLGTAGVLLAGVSFFGESLKPHALLGVIAIIGGVVLVSQ